MTTVAASTPEPVVPDVSATSEAASADAALPGPFCVDTHVHVYPVFDQSKFLNAASRNAQRHGGAPVLMLTESRGHRVFRTWREAQRVGPWSFVGTGEGETLIARRDDGTEVIVLAGRQVITSERLEVLALATDATVKDGFPIDETIAHVWGVGGLPVVPYGFGKWTGDRGRVVSRLIETHAEHGLVLGDNGGRPTLGPRPPHFDQAAAHRLTILPGTDPLPLRSCQREACRFGVVLDGPISLGGFAAEVRRRLAKLGPVPRRFGDHVSLPRAVYQQAALRLDRKLFGGRGLL